MHPLLPLLLASAILLPVTAPLALHAQPAPLEPVQGLVARPGAGFVTLHWQPVPGAAGYEIRRMQVDEAGAPGGAAVTVGIWRPNRQVNQRAPSFADAGFVPGQRYAWEVRPLAAELPGGAAALSPGDGDALAAVGAPPAGAVVATTLHAPGPEAFRTQFESAQGAEYTSHEAELEWTARLVKESRRVRVDTIGFTVQGRPIHLFVLGYPEPPARVEEVRARPRAGANCNIHGTEPSGREGCFMMIRELAFSDDQFVLDLLAHTTVLVVPSINADGRAANTRGNAAGQDLNRDHARLTQPETQALARFLRDYAPQVMVDGHEYGNAVTCDLPLLWPRHSNTAPAVHDEAKREFVEGWFYQRGARDGWWACPYPPRGIDGAQTFSRVAGLKNMVVTLVEARSQGGSTRPAEEDVAANRRRKAYSQLWSIRQTLEYHRAHEPRIRQAIEQGMAFQQANAGPVVFHGDWHVEAFPAPHPGDSPPPPNPPGPEQMLSPPPCAYFIPDELYFRRLDDSANLPEQFRTTLGDRLGFHGVRVELVEGGFLVPMEQPLRGLINILLDSQTPPAPIAAAERVFDCPSREPAGAGSRYRPSTSASHTSREMSTATALAAAASLIPRTSTASTYGSRPAGNTIAPSWRWPVMEPVLLATRTPAGTPAGI
jgi:hypothetical protein